MSKKTIHILRYGTVAEKIHLEKAISAYDYLSINGNTAAYVSSAIAKFIVEKFFSKPDKGFFIDPITYAFQNEIHLLQSKSKVTGEKSIKKSVQKLIEIYGYPANKVLSGIPITTNDFSDINLNESFCERILDFQYNLVGKHIKDNDLQKYLDYAISGKNRQPSQFYPKFLIAPYFYLDAQDPNFDRWLEINRLFIDLSVKQSNLKFNNTNVYGQLVINKNILSDYECINKILDVYTTGKYDGLTIWVDDLNEHEASLDELLGFVSLLKGLKNVPVYNMYGGYFSIFLTHKNIALLNGVSHGLEYGESRKVYPVGGGIPVSKYYYLPIHQRLDFTKAYYLLEHQNIIDTTKENWGTPEKYYEQICRCGQCKKVIQNEMSNFIEFESKEFYEIHRKDQILRRKKASSDTKQNCLYHYLLCKKIEFSRIAAAQNIDSLLEELSDALNSYKNCDALKEEELQYLNTWSEVIRGL